MWELTEVMLERKAAIFRGILTRIMKNDMQHYGMLRVLCASLARNLSSILPTAGYSLFILL